MQSSVFADKNLRKSFENVEIPVIVEKKIQEERTWSKNTGQCLKTGKRRLLKRDLGFLAAVSHIDTEEEALEFIESIRKKHYNATHNCYAYVLGERFELQRFSDDGEPGGTAGKPILDVLTGEDIHDSVIVVTRYFGGTLLGTGGLVRAYSGAAKEGLLASAIITRKRGIKLKIRTEYTGLGKIQYILAQNGIHVLDTPVYGSCQHGVSDSLQRKGKNGKRADRRDKRTGETGVGRRVLFRSA